MDNTLDFTESKLKRRLKSLIAKPHQPFFIGGVAVAIHSMLVTTFGLAGYLDVDIRAFHISNIALIMPTYLFFGFLTTVLYRFLLSMPFAQTEYMRIFYTLTAGAVMLQIGFFLSSVLAFFGFLTVGAAQLYGIYIYVKKYRESNVIHKSDPFWMLFCFSFGALASLLFAVSIFFPQAAIFAENVAFYPFAVGVVFAVAQKMVLNFYAIYFSVSDQNKKGYITGNIVIAFVLLGLFKSLSFWFGIAAVGVWILGFGSKLIYDNSFILKKAPPILSILAVGWFWFFAGALVIAVSGILADGGLYLAGAHMLGAGFIGTMMIGFASRVALGHSNNKIDADRVTVLLFGLFELVVAVRLMGVFEPSLAIAAGFLWSMVFGAWFFRYFPLISK